MTAKNDVTGDKIKTKNVSAKYRDNYDIIFKKTTKTKSKQEKADQNVFNDRK